MRQELTLLRQAQRVDTVRHEDTYRGEGGQRDQHQRQEEVVAARELGDEEDPRQGGMHHPSHQARHPEQDIVLRRDKDLQRGEVIDQVGEDKAREAASKERGGEEPAAAAA